MKNETLRIGTWLSIGSPVIAELAVLSGFDWVLLDLEHGCDAEAALPNQLRALRGSTTRGIVRVGGPYPDLIARILDWGADGIMVPHVEYAADAENIIRAAYYPPRGRRGFSRTVRAHGYGLHPPCDASSTPLVLAQIESLVGVQNSEAIARVDGIDVLFVGPSDLRHDLKLHNNTTSDEYNQCLDKIILAAAKTGKETGILVREIDIIPTHIARGFTHIAVDSDLAILRNTYQKILSWSTRST